MTIRILIAEDQRIVREGLIALLEDEGGIEIVGEAADGLQALELYASLQPDVVLMDLQMPLLDGPEATRRIRELAPQACILVLTTYATDEFIFKALRAGARGYLLKDVTLDQLIGAVRTLASGGTLLQPALTDRLLRAVSSARPSTVEGFERPEPLTARELDVLRLVAAGYSNNEIASALHLAAGTVKNHVTAVLLKLGVRDRTRAVLRALDLGLLEGPPSDGGGGSGRSRPTAPHG
jgi:DNA-binding NarL/FixJ family response regulator